MAEATKVSIFMLGLKSGSVRNQLYRVFPSSLEEDFSRRQAILDNSFSSYQRRQDPNSMDESAIQSTRRNYGEIICHYCGKKGYIRPKCPTPHIPNIQKKSEQNGDSGSCKSQ